MTTEATDQPSVTAAGLRKQFEGDDVIKGIDVDIAPGTILGLIGPSGCGKTTTVRLLTGLLAADRGRRHGLRHPGVATDRGPARPDRLPAAVARAVPGAVARSRT